MPHVDLAFRLIGTALPVDHGYALYAALCRLVPALHEAGDVGVHPVRGTYLGAGRLHLGRTARLVVRLLPELIPNFLTLAGKELAVDGARLRVGVPEVRPIRSSPTLYCRLATIKGFMDTGGFARALERQLVRLGADGRISVGERRTLRVRDKQVVGFEVTVSGLAPDASMRVQATGLGGRRRMGCGIFAPMRATGPR